MKKLFLVLFCLFTVMMLPAQQAKRVYITLDVSGSMAGDKYALANYTTQMIVTLCDEADEVSMIVTGKEYSFPRSGNPLQKLQYPIQDFPLARGFDRDDEFKDIIAFTRLYKPSKDKQDWLFVIGDGDWDSFESRYDSDRANFQKLVEKGTLNVCYLQAHASKSISSDFTKFVSTLGVVDIGKSDTKPKTIKDGCNRFARKILGFSDVPLTIKDAGNQCVSFTAELPIAGFYLVYQDETDPSALPGLSQVTANGTTLQGNLKGTPTTQNLKDQDATVDLSGNVWQVKSKGLIPANTSIEICFDKPVNRSNISIYPIVADISFGSLGISRTGGKLKQLDSRTFTICRDESKATVRIELDDASTGNLPMDLLKKTAVVVKANNKDYPASFQNGGFECEIELLDEETPYYAECDCPGYFKRVTPIMKIVKGDCDPIAPKVMDVNERPSTDLGSITFEALKRDKLTFTIHDEATKDILNPDLFNITFDIENDFLYEKPKVQIDNNNIILELHPKGEWCECLFPTNLNIKMVSTPKAEAFDEYGKNYSQTVFPIHMEVEKDRSWLSRCLWVIISILALIAFFFYLRALRKKRRFKKYASIVPTYYNHRGNKIAQGGTPLRKEGFGAWFARWLLPGDERNTLTFTAPDTTLRFVAAESNEVVNIPKEGNIDPATMVIAGYNPKNDTKPKDPVRLGNKGRITILKNNGTNAGDLTFNSGGGTDGVFYRILLGVLQVASLVAIGFLIYLMIRSFM